MEKFIIVGLGLLMYHVCAATDIYRSASDEEIMLSKRKVSLETEEVICSENLQEFKKQHVTELLANRLEILCHLMKSYQEKSKDLEHYKDCLDINDILLINNGTGDDLNKIFGQKYNDQDIDISHIIQVAEYLVSRISPAEIEGGRFNDLIVMCKGYKEQGRNASIYKIKDVVSDDCKATDLSNVQLLDKVDELAVDEQLNKEKKKVEPVTREIKQENDPIEYFPRCAQQQRSFQIDYNITRGLYFIKHPNYVSFVRQRKAIPEDIGNLGCMFMLNDSAKVECYIPLDLVSWLSNEGMKKQTKLLVKDYSKFPWNVHGCLMTSEEQGTFLGSAILIQPEYLLTAAHNVFDRETHTVADRVTFYPCSHGEYVSHPKQGTRIIIDKEYYELGTENKDFALIKLNEPLHISTYAILDLTEEEANNSIKKINITGYPGKPPFYGRYMISSELDFKKKCKAENGRIYYGVKTQKGQSGSAIWFQPSDQDCYLIGIHTSGDGTSKGTGVFFNPENVKRIRSWLQYLPN